MVNEKKAIVFDSGTLISFVDSCQLSLLKTLLVKLNIRAYIPNSVAKEAIDRPSKINKYMLYGLRLKQAVNEGWIKVMHLTAESRLLVNKLLEYFNNVYFIENTPLKIVQEAEIDVLALAKQIKAKVVAIDERTTRFLLEKPLLLKNLLERRYGRKIEIKKHYLSKLKEMFSDILVVRSVDLAAYAFKKGFLPKNMLKASLMALKYNGCGISEKSIIQYYNEVWKDES